MSEAVKILTKEFTDGLGSSGEHWSGLEGSVCCERSSDQETTESESQKRQIICPKKEAEREEKSYILFWLEGNLSEDLVGLRLRLNC